LLQGTEDRAGRWSDFGRERAQGFADWFSGRKRVCLIGSVCGSDRRQRWGVRYVGGSGWRGWKAVWILNCVEFMGDNIGWLMMECPFPHVPLGILTDP